MSENLRHLLENRELLLVHQVKEWAEIIANFETRNKYEVLDERQNKLGFIAERNKGFLGLLARQVFRSHRSMEIQFWNERKEELLSFKRPFYWFFSELSVFNESGLFIGSLRRRFSLIHKMYDLKDERGKRFGQIKAPFWKLWAFPIFDESGGELGKISKSWGGLLKEVFTDADRFQIQFGKLSVNEKAVVLAASISIDLDYFEDNEK